MEENGGFPSCKLFSFPLVSLINSNTINKSLLLSIMLFNDFDKSRIFTLFSFYIHLTVL